MWTTPMSKVVGVLLSLLIALPALSHSWPSHRKRIRDIEADTERLQQELSAKIEKKNTTRDQARVEETLQRIVEIHAELISLRRDYNILLSHIRAEHPAEGRAYNLIEAQLKMQSARRNYQQSPINLKLDKLLRKIQMKYAHFIETKAENDAVKEVEKVVQQRQKERKERESRAYLRRKSKVKLVK